MVLTQAMDVVHLQPRCDCSVGLHRLKFECADFSSPGDTPPRHVIASRQQLYVNAAPAFVGFNVVSRVLTLHVIPPAGEG